MGKAMEIRGSALVTGASRGIGRAVVLELLERGFPVVATMRDPGAGDALRERAGANRERLRIARLDVERPETIQIPDDLQVLVNNAGTEAEYLPLEHAPMAQWRGVFETNVFGLVEVTRRAATILRERGEGVVCNISSASLLFPMPFYSVYRASKAAVAALGESLRSELAPFGVRVLEVMPGPVETDMLAGSDREPEATAHTAYRPLANWAWESRRGMDGGFTPAAQAAKAIADAIFDPKSPLRVACDPTGAAMIAAADASAHESLQQGALSAMSAAVMGGAEPEGDADA